ncbi:AAA family ATPase [Paraburkholderia xenovorans]|uniref:AAA family ATPase n=1 Tax=Paraburkholderia xenovorans TaxID=36873 RepID=UPI00155842C3|nr:AAA family ATPase [Paraburkholderia xenovorans]NPT37503.1 AAA family ATPase [Paraburkholderia xenovorans]
MENLSDRSDASTLKIDRIELHGLFGLYTHVVQLHVSERVTIIHGPNGVGKTVLLRLIEGLFRGRYLLLWKTVYRSFSVRFTNGTCITVERLQQPRLVDTPSEPQPEDIVLRLSYADEHPHIWRNEPTELAAMAQRVNAEVPWISRVGPDTWEDDRTGMRYSSAELIAQFGDILPERFRDLVFREPEWLARLRQRVPVHLVETQRLLRTPDFDETRYSRRGARDVVLASTVKSYARALHRLIADNLALYGKQSQSLDQTFPQRMLDPTLGSLEVSELKTRMSKLDEKRRELKRIGLIEDDLPSPFNIDTLDSVNPTQLTVMTLYVQDTAAKLGTLEDLARRVILLLDNINKKFKHKSIGVNRSTGLVAYDRAGDNLDLDALSSGEQHEIVLMYDLLFRVKPNTLVLIDEPELSLHVTWQKAFLRDLLGIVAAANFDVILATHSPFVVGDRNDLAIALVPDLDHDFVTEPQDELFDSENKIK